MNFNGEIFLGGIPIFAGNITIDGDLKVLGRVLLSNGSAGAPSLAFTSEPTLGIAKTGTGELSICSGGSAKASFSGTQVGLNVPLDSGSNTITTTGGMFAGTMNCSSLSCSGTSEFDGKADFKDEVTMEALLTSYTIYNGDGLS